MIIDLRRRPRTATAIQLTETNIEDCLAFIHSMQSQVHGTSIIIRRNGTHVETLAISEWALRGEDGKIRILSDEELKSKYEVASER